LRVFNSTTQPLVDHYDDQVLVSVDGYGDVRHLTRNILASLVKSALLGQVIPPAIADAPEPRRPGADCRLPDGRGPVPPGGRCSLSEEDAG